MIEAPDLITLDEVKRTRGLDTPDQTVDDALLIQFIHAASATVFNRSGRSFVPYRGIRVFDGLGQHLQQSRTCLDLDDDLLELTEVLDDSEPISLGVVVKENANILPYWRLRLTSGRWGGNATLSSIAVDGLWGYHDAYARAWEPMTTLAAGIDDTVTVVDVADLTGLSPLAYLKVNDEFMQVTTVNQTDGLIEVRRGVRGTTAAAALSAATVSVYRPIADIAHACNRLVSFYYDRRDTIGERVSFGTNALLLEGAIPPEITQSIDARRRLSLMFM